MIILKNFEYYFVGLFSLACITAGCNKQNEINKAKLFPDVNTEIENWKRQLILNGDVGYPCQEDADKWMKQNPDRFYGLPKEAIQAITFDANNDKINDVLLYFPAGDCCSCSVGVNEASDFVKLIFSDGADFLSNENLREKIMQKIESEYFAQTNTDVEHTVFFISEFNSEISGTFKLWTAEDPDCCASVEGKFKYNPFTFKIIITSRNVNQI